MVTSALLVSQRSRALPSGVKAGQLLHASRLLPQIADASEVLGCSADTSRSMKGVGKGEIRWCSEAGRERAGGLNGEDLTSKCTCQLLFPYFLPLPGG